MLRHFKQFLICVQKKYFCENSVKQKKIISLALKNRLGRYVTLNIRVDTGLLGGAIIRANDLVIDGSALGKLNRLANYLG